MKNKIKNILIPLIISIILGIISAKSIYKIYEEDIETRLTSSKIYLLENGSYKNYDDMRKENIKNSYVYYKDKDLYKSVIGITKDKDNIEKIKTIFDDSIVIEEYYISSDIINNKQKEYDEILKKAQNTKEATKIINDIIELYKENNSINLILSK